MVVLDEPPSIDHKTNEIMSESVSGTMRAANGTISLQLGSQSLDVAQSEHNPADIIVAGGTDVTISELALTQWCTPCAPGVIVQDSKSDQLV